MGDKLGPARSQAVWTALSTVPKSLHQRVLSKQESEVALAQLAGIPLNRIHWVLVFQRSVWCAHVVYMCTPPDEL